MQPLRIARTHDSDWRPRAISLFSAKYTKVNARSNLCLESPKKKKRNKKIRGTTHQILVYELALEYFFTILWPKHSASRRKHRYSLRVCAIDSNWSL